MTRPVEPPTPAPSTEALSTIQAAPAEPQAAAGLSIAGLDPPAEDQSPGFGERGRIRRRVHFLLKARELAYRDLGGLVFDLHRFGQRHDALVAAKLSTLDSIDTELRTLQSALGERRSVTVLREAGVAACPRCAAIHGSDDRFCPSCGMPMGRRADRPIAVASGAPTTPAPVAPQPSSPVQAPGQTSLALGGSAPIPTPPPPATGSWTAELARPSTGLQRPSPPLEGASEQRTQIAHPGEHGDLSRGALRDRPDETPPAR